MDPRQPPGYRTLMTESGLMAEMTPAWISSDANSRLMFVECG